MDKPKIISKAIIQRQLIKCKMKGSKMTQCLPWFGPKWPTSSYGGIPQDLNLDYKQYRKLPQDYNPFPLKFTLKYKLTLSRKQQSQAL